MMNFDHSSLIIPSLTISAVFFKFPPGLADNYISRNWFQSFIDRNIPVQQP